MKKALVLLLALSLIGGLVFAEGLTVKASGSIKSIWGVDLDHGTSGFKYSVDSAQLKFDLGTNTECKATGDEGSTMYGEIAIGGIKLYTESAYGIGDNWDSFKSDSVGARTLQLEWSEVTAKLVLGPNLTIVLKDGADNSLNYTGVKEGWWLSNAYGYDVYSGLYGSNTNAQTGALMTYSDYNFIKFDVPGYAQNTAYNQNYNYGIEVDYNIPSMVNLTVNIASYQSFDDATTRWNWGNDVADNDYCGSFIADLKAVPNLTAVAEVTGGYLNNEKVAATAGVTPSDVRVLNFDFGGRLGYGLKVGETITVTPQVAADCRYNASTALTWFSAGGVTADLFGAKVTANVGFTSSIFNSLAYTISATSGSAVPGLTVQGAYEYIDNNILASATNDDTTAISAKLAYALKATEAVTITPYVKGSWDNKIDDTGTNSPDARLADPDASDLYAKVGVDVTGLLKNTTFSSSWDSNDLQQTSYNPLKLGSFTVTAKVSF
jgi:hypothetical protein